MSNAYMPQSKHIDWGTPRRIFDPLNAEFGFTLDVCASDWSAKCTNFFNEQQDGLAQSWAGHTYWCNPPYGAVNIIKWLKKADEEARSGARGVFLLPSTTDTIWFHRYVWDESRHASRPNIVLRFFKGRIKFDPPPSYTGSNPGNVKGSIIVVVNPAP